jgi:hypothetical protein
MVIFRMEGWEEMEIKKLKKKEKQTSRKKQNKNQTKFQRYKQGVLVY